MDVTTISESALPARIRATSTQAKDSAMSKDSNNPMVPFNATPEDVATFIRDFKGDFSELDRRFADKFGFTFRFFFTKAFGATTR